MSEFYAHSIDGRPKSEWETMSEHEERVAERCSAFLKRIHPDLEGWGAALGRWHDLGKYSDEFQQYISQTNPSDDNDAHQGIANIAAAIYAKETQTFGPLGGRSMPLAESKALALQAILQLWKLSPTRIRCLQIGFSKTTTLTLLRDSC